MVTGEKSLQRFVSSEGGRVVTPETVIRVVIQAETRAEDGMELMRVETLQAESMDKLPAAAEIDAKVEQIAKDLKALREAPVAEPYDGPALLSGRASGVFFHEVLGHRLEGQRQRGDEEGQTFTKKLNQAVLPEFLSVTDDPTLTHFERHPAGRLVPVRRRRRTGCKGRGDQEWDPAQLPDVAHADRGL